MVSRVRWKKKNARTALKKTRMTATDAFKVPTKLSTRKHKSG